MCYSVPVAASVVTTALWLRKKTVELWQLNLMLYGAAIFGFVDHLWNNELLLVSPDIAKDLLLGVVITLVVFAVWGVLMRRSHMSIKFLKMMVMAIVIFGGVCLFAYAEDIVTGKITGMTVADGVNVTKSVLTIKDDNGKDMAFNVQPKTVVLNDKSLATLFSRLKLGEEVKVRYNVAGNGENEARAVSVVMSESAVN